MEKSPSVRKVFCDDGSSFLTNWSLLYSNETKGSSVVFIDFLFVDQMWLIEISSTHSRMERFKLQKRKWLVF